MNTFLTRKDHDAFVIDILLDRSLAGEKLAMAARQAFCDAKKEWSLPGVRLTFRNPQAERAWRLAWDLLR